MRKLIKSEALNLTGNPQSNPMNLTSESSNARLKINKKRRLRKMIKQRRRQSKYIESSTRNAWSIASANMNFTNKRKNSSMKT